MAIAFAGSVTGSATNGGNVTLTIPSSAAVIGNCAVIAVTLGTTRLTALAVASSTGIAYTQIVTTTVSSFARFGVFRRIFASTAEVTLTITGTAGTSDAAACACLIFSGVSTSAPEDATPTSTTGASTTPDSPSITVTQSNCAIISPVGVAGSLLVPTAPSSFLNAISTDGNDTLDAATFSAWISNTSTSPYDPTPWGISVPRTWLSATIALAPAGAPSFTWFAPPQPERPVAYQGRRMTGY